MISTIFAIIEIIIILLFVSLFFVNAQGIFGADWCSEGFKSAWSNVFGAAVIDTLCLLFSDPVFIIIIVAVMSIAFIIIKTYVRLNLY